MKLNELLEGDIEDRAQMGDALSDVAAQHLVQIEEDPVAYYRQYGEQLQPNTAEEIQRILSAIDDKTFDLIANSPVIVRSMEDGGIDYDEPFIEVNALMDVLGRAKARLEKQHGPNELDLDDELQGRNLPASQTFGTDEWRDQVRKDYHSAKNRG